MGQTEQWTNKNMHGHFLVGQFGVGAILWMLNKNLFPNSLHNKHDDLILPTHSP